MSLLFYMFQSILNTFALGYLIGGKKLIIFTDGGYPPPFAENSAKIINLIFAPFPNNNEEFAPRVEIRNILLTVVDCRLFHPGSNLWTASEIIK